MIIQFVLVTILCFISFYLYFIRGKLQYWEKRNVPHKKPHPIFGNLLDFLKYMKTLDHNDYKVNYYNRFHKERYYGMYLLDQPILVLRDPELIKCVMITKFDHFTDRQDFGNDYDILVQNLLSSRGNKWKTLRQQLLPIFTSNKLKRMFHLILEQAEDMADYIGKYEVNSDSTHIKSVIQQYTMNLIGSTGFGLNFTMEKDQCTDYHKMGYGLLEANFKNAFRFGIRLFLQNIANFLRLRVFTKKTEDFFMKVIEDIVKSRQGKPSNRNDFIDLLLQLKENTDTTDESIQIDNKFIAGQSFTFFAAGFETTSTTLMYILIELAHNPEIQDKLYNEIDEIVQKCSGKLTYEAIHQAPYLEAVISESLRKYPLMMLIPRICTQPFKLPDTDLCIEKGLRVLVPIIEIQNDPKYYVDPEKFDPERFMDDNSTRQTTKYMPFGIGPRSCIAIKFAYLQIKIGLISILRHYKVQFSGKYKYPIEIHAPMIVSKPKSEILLKITKRD